MAAEDGAETSRLIQALLASPERFAFAQAVRLLEGAVPGAPHVGELGPAQKEAIRFRPNTSLGFPPADLHSIEAPGEEFNPTGHYRMTVNFMGLYGSTTPLPTFYAEEILRDGEEEDAPRDFLDVFHHRVISLFFRGWAKYRYYVRYQPGARDVFSRWLLSLIGLGHLRLGKDTSLNGDRLLSYLGLLSMRSHSASILGGIVSHYFDGVRVEVKQCIERQVEIPAIQRNALGRHNTTLGRDTLMGASSRDRSGKFRLVLGPLTRKEFFDYLPPGRHFRPLRELILFALSGFLEFDVELVAKPREMPPLELAADNPCRLGWSSWLGHHGDSELSVVLPGKLAA